MKEKIDTFIKLSYLEDFLIEYGCLEDNTLALKRFRKSFKEYLESLESRTGREAIKKIEKTNHIAKQFVNITLLQEENE